MIVKVLESQLKINHLTTGYSKQIVIKDLSMEIKPNEILCLIGHNGAGKSTLLNSIFGIQRITEGEVLFNNGVRLDNTSPAHSIASGVMLVPQYRCSIAGLTVLENLELSTYARREVNWRSRVNYIFNVFPILHQKKDERAGLLSGGQQQMLSIGMGLMAKPKLLLLDEPSVGLAPAVVEEVMNAIKRVNEEEGITILMVEQNLKPALRISQRVLVMRAGSIVMDSDPKDILSKEESELWGLF